MPGKVFISYSSVDQETANKLIAEIERCGIPCWISSRDIRPGEDYQKAIVTALKDASVFLLLFSENANKSTEIPRELALAGKYKKTVIPARVQDIVPSEAFDYLMTSAQFIDLFHDFDAKIKELCVRLAELLQISEVVTERIRQDNQRHLEEQNRAAHRRKLKRAAILVIVALLFVGGVAAWWMLVQHNAVPSTDRQSTALSSVPPAVLPVVPTNSPTPAPAFTTPSATINSTNIAPPKPQVTPPVAVTPTQQEPTPTIQASPAPLPVVASPTPIPIVASNSVPFASSEASIAKYAQAIKSALATLAPSSPFVGGKYIDSDGLLYTVYGPGVSFPGQTSWSIALDANQHLNKQYQAAWTTGPANQNPDLANKRHLDTLPAGFSYGFARQPNGAFTVIGARMQGNSLQITTFVDASGWKQNSVFIVSRPGS